MAGAIPWSETENPQRDMIPRINQRSIWSATMRECRSRIKMNSKDLEARLTLGMTYRLCQDFAAALATWQSILEIEPKHDAARKAIRAVEAELVRMKCPSN